METIIKNRVYAVEKLATPGTRVQDDLKQRGWDGENYLLTNKKTGRHHLGYRCAKTGDFCIVH